MDCRFGFSDLKNVRKTTFEVFPEKWESAKFLGDFNLYMSYFGVSCEVSFLIYIAVIWG